MHSLTAKLIAQHLDKSASITLHKQLYSAIRQCILESSLVADSRLPASRDLAKALQLSRNTVLSAYEQLQAEGYIYTQRGQGTFVNKTQPRNPQLTQHELTSSLLYSSEVQLSKRGEALLQHASSLPTQWTALMPGAPDVNAFPHILLSRIQSRIARQPKLDQLIYSQHGGSTRLQQVLAHYLASARSVHCEPEQILITEGIHQALDLVTRMLCNPKDNVWLEDPSYWGTRAILRMNDLATHAVKVDDQGLVPPAQGHLPNPRMIFVTPSHQYPLGSVMSLSRRYHLLSLARSLGAWIVEDDYDSAFRFSGTSIPALQGLEADAPVIYIGSFSKTLYPALRLGYMVLPKTIAQQLKTAHCELYHGGHLMLQDAMAEFIQNGHYASHIRRMCKLYAKRRQHLIGLIEQHLGKHALGSYNSNAGLHLILNLASNKDDIAIAQAANEQGILVRALSKYYLHEKRVKGLIVGFANTPVEDMEKAFSQLLQCIDNPQYTEPEH
ncbi:PLP-dependent aminotransferase family protein [Pseudomonas sp. F1_0610]|uniref:MocR-like pyridoxine biosynthesis transcription factor PdxR n=1 Tax=Pseudomonas sp. F1_0610 TaxID=3114284 RepID=UPI0039C01F67